jgi:hypothetical protein
MTSVEMALTYCELGKTRPRELFAIRNALHTIICASLFLDSTDVYMLMVQAGSVKGRWLQACAERFASVSPPSRHLQSSTFPRYTSTFGVVSEL